MFIINEFAKDYFHDQIKEGEGKTIGYSYLKERGLRDDIIEKFALGYCLDGWDKFTNAALDKGYKLDLLQQLGLTKVRDDKKYDFYRGRVMFPIRNLTGKTLGFGGRTLRNDKKTAKYFNSPESPIYYKSKTLYGIYEGKKAISNKDNCYLVEGYTDVTSLHQAGIENVVASSGTSLTTEQIRLIKRYTPNITVLFDGDIAGIKASFRGIDMILKEGMNVRAITFPEGEDPDSYSQKLSTSEFEAYLEDEKKDFIQFKADLLLSETEKDPIKKAQAITDIVASISLVPDAISRSVFIKQCSELFKIDEKSLHQSLNQQLRKQFNKSGKASSPKPNFDGPPPPDEMGIPEHLMIPDEYQEEYNQSKKLSIDNEEKEVIRLLFNYANLEVEIDQENEEGEIEKVVVSAAELILHELLEDEIKFDDVNCQQIIEESLAQFEEFEEIKIKHFFQHANKDISKLAIDLTSSPYLLSENWEKAHFIYVVPESDKLKLAIEHAIYSFKFKKVRVMIEENQEKLKTATPEDITDILENQINLEKIKAKIAKELNRTIL